MLMDVELIWNDRNMVEKNESTGRFGTFEGNNCHKSECEDKLGEPDFLKENRRGRALI